MTGAIRVFISRMLDTDTAMYDNATSGPWRHNAQKVWIPKNNKGVFVVGMREEYVAAGPEQEPICVAATGFEDDPQSCRDARFIAYMDPSRLKAAVASKRRMLKAHREIGAGPDAKACRGCGFYGPSEIPWCTDVDQCPILRAIASEYRHETGFQSAWLDD